MPFVGCGLLCIVCCVLWVVVLCLSFVACWIVVLVVACGSLCVVCLLFVVCCLLLVVCCPLSVYWFFCSLIVFLLVVGCVCCSLLVRRVCSVCVVCSSLLLDVCSVCCGLFCCWLFVVGCLLLVDCDLFLVFVVCCVGVFGVRCVLLVVWFWMRVSCCVLFSRMQRFVRCSSVAVLIVAWYLVLLRV